MNGAGGGAALSTLALVEGLRRFGIESSIVCDAAGSAEERARLAAAVDGRCQFTTLYWWNRKIRTAPWKRPLFELWQGLRTGWARRSARQIARFATEVGADLIHTNTILTPDGGIAARDIGLVHVWHVRELTGSDQPFRLRRSGTALARYLTRQADCLVANSASSAAPFVDLIPKRYLRIVPNAIDVTAFSPPSAEERVERATRPVVAMVANLTSRVKNHTLFLEMAAQLERHPVDLRIYGHDPCSGGRDLSSSYCREIHSRIEELGLRGEVSFPGFLEAPARIMREIDVLVHPVPHESFGRVVVEAMAASVPVVGIAAGGVGDLVVHDRTGRLVPPGDPITVAKALASEVDELVAHADLRDRLGQEGRRVVERDYSIEPHLERMVAAYQTAVENHARPAIPSARSRKPTDP